MLFHIPFVSVLDSLAFAVSEDHRVVVGVEFGVGDEGVDDVRCPGMIKCFLAWLLAFEEYMWA